MDNEIRLVGSCLATKVFIGNLTAMGRGWQWVIMKYANDEQRSTTNKIHTCSYLTVIGVHSTMHLMHPNYCQITIMYVL